MWPQFITAAPSPKNAVDLFSWVSQLPVSGLKSGTQNFDEDRRVEMLLEAFGSIQGFNVLELGPLEASHTHQLEQLGARAVLGIEASPEFYLKCLIAKEILGLKANFLLGDFNLYLEPTDQTFDLVFASGVLYHMSDPVHTLYLIAKAAPRVFIWTHYIGGDETGFQAKPVERHGFQCEYYEVVYDPNSHSRGWAGVNPSACRLKKETILSALESFGFDRIVISEDQPNHPGGPALSLTGENTKLQPKNVSSPDDDTEQARYYRELSIRLRAHIEELTPRLMSLHEQKLQAEARAQEQIDQFLQSPAWRETIKATENAERCRLQLEQMQARQASDRKQLEQILQSHSWKLTAPLRYSRTLLGRLLKQGRE